MPYDVIIGRNKEDKKDLGERGLIDIGKGYVQMGQYTSLSNRILMDVAKSHVVLVAGKRGCLTEDTLVFTDKGYKKIIDFDNKEDKVLSFNKETEKFEWEKAELLEYAVEEDLIKIEFENGKELKLTSEHPLLKNENKKLNWEKACKLKIGDKIVCTNDNKNIKYTFINDISHVEDIKRVYDLSVDKNHSFIANGIISHNSGKSYTLGVLAEELSDLPEPINNNIASIIFDTMGIYWTMKYKNEKDKSLLDKWNLKSKELPVKIFVPFGFYEKYTSQGIPVDKSFALDPSELNAEDWIITFGLDLTNPVSVIIERTINKLKEKGSFSISEIIENINKDETTSQETKNAAIGLFESANTWGIFSNDKKNSTKISDLINAGKTTIIDLSVYNSIGALNVRGLVINLISRKIFNQRMADRRVEEIKSVSSGLNYFSSASNQEKKENPLVWIFIDEAHEFLPLDKKTVATDALVQLLREGRQPGISLVLATQQPGQIHRDVMTQSDIVISHRVTNHYDLQALNYIMQSYVFKGLKKYMDELPGLKGSAIILDDNSERIYSLRMRPRFTWHGGEAPSAVSKEKEL